ncbi:hypothetical protein F5Y18DRAFT_436166 [Xylariaceae sp. FL1019]|nr:hypothetical protein F5Y18DRAFT_436166 [Xylariaceae sp. FL1019]
MQSIVCFTQSHLISDSVPAYTCTISTIFVPDSPPSREVALPSHRMDRSVARQVEQAMAESIVPPWISSRRRQWRERYNVHCDLGHIHSSNMPATGLVLVRMHNQQLEIFLDLRSAAVSSPGTWALIGGLANDISEEPVRVALREAREEYNILGGDIKLSGHQWMKDHGANISYTYIIAEWLPTDPNKNLRSTSAESLRGQWFAENAMPTPLHSMLAEDMPVIWAILNQELIGTVNRAQAMATEEAVQTTPRVENPAPATERPAQATPRINEPAPAKPAAPGEKKADSNCIVM